MRLQLSKQLLLIDTDARRRWFSGRTRRSWSARPDPESQVRIRLPAGGKWIRTLGPTSSPASNEAFYRVELYIDTGVSSAERGAARFGGGNGAEHLLWAAHQACGSVPAG
jgi:hypothetical protein